MPAQPETIFCALCGVILAATMSCAVDDEYVALRFRAYNPQDEIQLCEIEQTLPPWFSTNDIVDLDGLALSFNATNGTYFLYKNLDLGPNEIVAFNPVLRDLWTIRPRELKAFRERVAEAWTKLKRIQDESAQWTDYGRKIDGDFIVFSSGLPLRGTNVLDSVPDVLPGVQERHALTPTGLSDLQRLESDRRGFNRLKGALTKLEELIERFDRDPKTAWHDVRWRQPYRPVVDATLLPLEKKQKESVLQRTGGR